ncbi:MAG TPA: hypothetical protein VGL60_01545 [Acidimicrobiales bacterium]|jgi:hypothetical protein
MAPEVGNFEQQIRDGIDEADAAIPGLKLAARVRELATRLFVGLLQLGQGLDGVVHGLDDLTERVGTESAGRHALAEEVTELRAEVGRLRQEVAMLHEREKSR